MVKMEDIQNIYAKTIQEKVFDFYTQNFEKCNAAYSLAEDPSISQIYASIQNEADKNALLATTAIVLLTANKYERNILHSRVFSLNGKKISKFEINLSTACDRFNRVYAYGFTLNGLNILHIHANVTGSYTIGGSADIVRWISSNKYLFPRTIVSFGVCFGTDDAKYHLGDVIISKKIYPYFIGAKINDTKLTAVDDNAFTISPDLYNTIKGAKDNNNLYFPEFNVELDNYITGEAVVSSLKARLAFEGITTQDTPVGEMEGYGLFKECNCKDYNVPCLVLKSICDWGAEKNFDINNKTMVKSFMEKLNFSSIAYGNDKDAIVLLQSLKDRLQAYSADCAFSVLDVLLRFCDFGKSLFLDMKDWLINYNGNATTCKMLREEVYRVLDTRNIRNKPCEYFVHKSLMLLEDSGVVECDPDCLHDDISDYCIKKASDAVVRIKGVSVCNSKKR